MIYNAEKITELIKEWNGSKSPDALEEIVTESTALAEVIASGFSDDSLFREDLIQECLAKLITALPHYNPDIANAHKYFTSVFRNTCISFMANESKQFKLSNELQEYFMPHPNKSNHIKDILTQLTARNRTRFPSVDAEVLDSLTNHIFAYLLNGSVPGNGAGIVKDAMQRYDISRNVIIIIYHSSLIYLRMNYTQFIDLCYVAPDEYSLLPDLVELLGEEAYERLLIAFAGMSIKIPA